MGTSLHMCLPCAQLVKIVGENSIQSQEKNMVEVVDCVLKAQEASEIKFAEVEEKRIKLEQKMIESEKCLHEAAAEHTSIVKGCFLHAKIL